MELRKDTIRTPTRLTCAEGNMNGSDSASSCSVRRSRRPQARLDTLHTRTGRPRRFLWPTLSDRTAGEGLGRTARVHVCEESHRGIVPMNHSNNDGPSSAESEEGRLRLKEKPRPTLPKRSCGNCIPRFLSAIPKGHRMRKAPICT
jgi:hypothetical protein